MSYGYLLIDGNSIGFANYNTRPLIYDGEVVQGIFGFMRSIKKLKDDYRDFQLIVLWDGHSWRYDIYKDYKANRKSNPQHVKIKEGYSKQLPKMQEIISHLGIPQQTFSNMEADDLAFLMKNKVRELNKRVVLVSGDKDWLQLIDADTIWYDPIRNKIVNEKTFEKFTGCKDVKQFVESKCLTGDVSDNIKGVGGIGAEGAKQFMQLFGSVDNFLSSDKIKNEELSSKFRSFREDKEKQEIYNLNLTLMDLSTKNRPKPINRHCVNQDFDNNKFLDFCYRHGFASIIADADNWKKTFS